GRFAKLSHSTRWFLHHCPRSCSTIMKCLIRKKRIDSVTGLIERSCHTAFCASGRKKRKPLGHHWQQSRTPKPDKPSHISQPPLITCLSSSQRTSESLSVWHSLKIQGYRLRCLRNSSMILLRQLPKELRPC